jgi:hypothetical protein
MRSNILSILEKQIICLEKNNFKKFNRLFQKEAKHLSRLIEIFNRLNINEDYKLYAKFSIPRRKMFALKASIGLILLSLVSSYFMFSIKKASYNIDNINSSNLTRVVKEYEQKDLAYETKLEKDFEKLYGANILGEYTEMDLEWVNLITMMYGKNILRELGVKRIIFVQTSRNIRNTREFENETRSVAGVAFHDRKTILLASGRCIGSWNTQDVFINVFLHELAHIIHYKVMAENPEFNKEWEKIEGGYVDSYQKKNIYEDVAVVAERALSVGLMGRVTGKTEVLTTLDKNPEAFNSKVALLQKYGFFPKMIIMHPK